MGRTLLLAFIHGFKGDVNTFGDFPQHLKGIVAESLKDDQVELAVYPKYETKGDLAQCTANFTEWLKERVMELRKQRCEVPWPPNDNSVGVILVAHSMGGLIASDALFSILDDKREHSHEHLFPLVQGVLAFDTPYNGLARSMFVYGAFSNYQKVSSVWNTMSAVSAGLYSVAIPRMATRQAATTASSTVSRAAKWKGWQLLAVRSGTVGAIAAGGVAAYIHREQIMNGVRSINRETLTTENIKKGASQAASQGYDALGNGLAYINKDNIGQSFEWLSTHLQFVGALMRQKEMNHRLERLAGLKGVGVQNLYISLGENGVWSGGYFVPERTFCAVPEKGQPAQAIFTRVVNPDAKDEIVGHTTIFNPALNPVFTHLSDVARDTIVNWFQDESEIIDTVPVPLSTQAEKVIVSTKELEDNSNPEELIEKDVGTSDDESPLDIVAAAASIPLPTDVEGDANTTERQRYVQSLLRIAQSAGSGVVSTGWSAGSGVASAGWNIGSTVGSMIPKRGESTLKADPVAAAETSAEPEPTEVKTEAEKGTEEKTDKEEVKEEAKEAEPEAEKEKEKEAETKPAAPAKSGWGVKSLLGRYRGGKSDTESDKAEEQTEAAQDKSAEATTEGTPAETIETPADAPQESSTASSKDSTTEVTKDEPASTEQPASTKGPEVEETTPAETALPTDAADDVKVAVEEK